MTDQQKIYRVFLIAMVVLGIAAVVRVKEFPPKPEPVTPDIFEQLAQNSTPECARLIREESNRLDQDDSVEDARTKTFLKEASVIESDTDISETEKEIRLRRLSERDDIGESTQKANSDIAFINEEQKLEEAGCYKK